MLLHLIHLFTQLRSAMEIPSLDTVPKEILALILNDPNWTDFRRCFHKFV